MKLNLWNEKRMRGAVNEFREQEALGKNPNVHFSARAWNMPRSILQRKVKGRVQGADHMSGCKPYISE